MKPWLAMGAAKPRRGSLALTEQDAAYQQVNRTVHDDEVISPPLTPRTRRAGRPGGLPAAAGREHACGRRLWAHLATSRCRVWSLAQTSPSAPVRVAWSLPPPTSSKMPGMTGECLYSSCPHSS